MSMDNKNVHKVRPVFFSEIVLSSAIQRILFWITMHQFKSMA
ncbi:hypothetical protein J663_3130 [Acinetobacter sp. 826659]|nr:hypothetical protein J663_3130 [Acinetobacter sp. 826659]